MTPDNDAALDPSREKIAEAAADLDAAAQLETEQLLAALIAEAKPILLQDFDGKIGLVGDWPAVACIAPVLLTQADLFQVDGTKITITLANTHATYELAGMDGESAIARLTADHGTVAPAAPSVDVKAGEILETLEDPKAPDVAPAEQPKPLPELADGGPVLSIVLAPDRDTNHWTVGMMVRRGGNDYHRLVERKEPIDDDALAGLQNEFAAEVEDALASGTLRDDGPTLAEFEKASYHAGNYPPRGYLSKHPVRGSGTQTAGTRPDPGLTTEPTAGANPNVKCPECKMYGARHRPSCSRGGG